MGCIPGPLRLWPQPPHQAVPKEEPPELWPQTVPLVADRRQPFGQPDLNADTLGAGRWPSGGPPVGLLTFPPRGPRPILRFPLLAEVDFPPYRIQQELFPRNPEVLVEVMANALSQP